MILIEDVIEVHQMVIAEHGGASGIKDFSLLDSAINRPFSTFDGQDLYPTVVSKSAALIQSIVQNHPFNDGNKRTGYVVCRSFLKNFGFDISASEDEKYDFVISISKGAMQFEEINDWITKHLIEISI